MNCIVEHSIICYLKYIKQFAKWIILCIAIALLTGCAQRRFKVTHVKGVNRSCAPYFVRGSWHYPQKYYEYDKIGLASWYGPRFHGKRKANGEIYNQYVLSAAHKTLPLPSIVRVTNLSNKKSVDLLVDDRGPFVYKGRIIDLSFAAAKYLDIYNSGIGKVRVKTLVKHSDLLSKYLHHHGSGNRSWRDVYDEEILKLPPRRTPMIIYKTNKIKSYKTNHTKKSFMLKRKYSNQILNNKIPNNKISKNKIPNNRMPVNQAPNNQTPVSKKASANKILVPKKIQKNKYLVPILVPKKK